MDTTTAHDIAVDESNFTTTATSNAPAPVAATPATTIPTAAIPAAAILAVAESSAGEPALRTTDFSANKFCTVQAPFTPLVAATPPAPFALVTTTATTIAKATYTTDIAHAHMPLMSQAPIITTYHANSLSTHNTATKNILSAPCTSYSTAALPAATSNLLPVATIAAPRYLNVSPTSPIIGTATPASRPTENNTRQASVSVISNVPVSPNLANDSNQQQQER
ncbi:mucin-7-like [Topomyia yanbarensis]|uniref:mucin-7-like n=1 Tax=Topomyia yanbarensis TaxID=2498891 RepID=UPI00273CED69|nr:mucin-7-like [Topomyia yanbarensis]